MSQKKTKSLQQRIEPGTSRACIKCKHGVENSADPSQGACLGMKAVGGATWKRLIPDYYNTTCDNFEAGETYFRDRV